MKFHSQTVTVTGDTLAAIETDIPGHFGGLQVMRVVRIPAGTAYKSSRTKGVKVLAERTFDARRFRQVDGATAWALGCIVSDTAASP